MKSLARSLALMISMAAVISSAGGPASSREQGIATPSSLERAKALLDENKPADALALLATFSPAYEERASYQEVFATALVALKKPYESIEHYRLAYVNSSSPAVRERLLLARADVYASMRYFSESAVCYELFLKLFPKSGSRERAEMGLADARYHTGDMRAALAHYEKAGESSRALMGKANALQALGRTPEAHRVYQALMEQDPKAVNASPETLYAMGENYRQSGELKDARVYFESVKDPVLKFRAALGLGLIAMAENLNDAAVAHFSTAVESPEREVRREAIMHRAEANMKLKKFDLAKTALLEIRNGYPYGKTYDTAVLLLAKLYRTEGKSAQAVELLKTLIYRRDPEAAALDEIESIIRETKDKNHAEFVKLWNAAGRWLLNANRTAALISIAQGLRHDGRPFFEICSWLIKYGSDEAKSEGRLLLADFYVDGGDPATALSFLRRARPKMRTDRVLRIEAKILLANGNAPKAASALTALAEPTEEDLALLIDAMGGLKTVGPEIAFCERAFRKKTPSARTAVRLADVLFRRGDERQALAYYRMAASRRDATKTDPDVEWAEYRIANAADAAESSEALKTLQTGDTSFGRYAAAELQGLALKQRLGQEGL